MRPDEKVVDFPAPSDEKQRHALAEAERLSNLSEADWQFQLSGSAERLGIPVTTLQKMVTAFVREHEQKADEAKSESRRQQARIDKEAALKRKEKQKAFSALVKLPSARHEIKLIELAKHLDEDVALLRDEFSEFAGASTASAA